MSLHVLNKPILSVKRSIKTILGIAAGKGGVGKSTVAVNLALALQAKGYRVGLLDADIYGPSLRKMLPEITIPQQQAEWITPALCFGIKMISMAFFRPSNEAAAIRAPIANQMISRFLNKVIWGELDFLIIDFPPGTGDIQLTLAQQAKIDAAIMVTTPQEIALLDVRKAISLFYQVGVSILGIVENMSYYQPSPESPPVYLFGKGGGEQLAQETQTILLGQIPIDPGVSTRADRGFSIFIDDGTGELPAASAFLKMAEVTLKQLSSNRQKKQHRYLLEFIPIDAHNFSIVWDNGIRHSYQLHYIQQQCPCAKCQETPMAVEEKVSVHRVHKVGLYALRFEFSSGCSHGIYPFDMLYQLGESTLK